MASHGSGFVCVFADVSGAARFSAQRQDSAGRLRDVLCRWKEAMTAKPSLIKVGLQGISVGGVRIPASFFRHQMPGKRFVVLAEGDRRLMHVHATDMETIRRAYREYVIAKGGKWPVRHGKLTRR